MKNKETRNREIEIIFWPQYLQYLGFVALMLTFLILGRGAWRGR